MTREIVCRGMHCNQLAFPEATHGEQAAGGGARDADSRDTDRGEATVRVHWREAGQSAGVRRRQGNLGSWTALLALLEKRIKISAISAYDCFEPDGPSLIRNFCPTLLVWTLEMKRWGNEHHPSEATTYICSSMALEDVEAK